MTGNKWEDKIYRSYSGWRSGLKELTAKEVFQKDPTALVRFAVKGMLPKNRLNRSILNHLKMYPGNEHPHTAQV